MQRPTTVESGRRGEAIAALYLELSGHRIVARNLRLGALEIDLVTERGELTCFVEVRQRRRSSFGGALETVVAAKQRRLREAARRYLARHPRRHCRFDVIAIDWRPGGGLELTHVRDAW
ncbi:MAG: YraN family protein [Candidatus Eiseniibacteriota bacterium]|jgi:putative endonuclease